MRDPDARARLAARTALAVALMILCPFASARAAVPGADSAGIARGTLVVAAAGLRDARGQVLARLFRPGDNVLAHESWRGATAVIRDGKATLAFPDLAFGSYALVVAHDRNGNGVIDHNALRLPAEPLAFSGNYHMSLFAGVPTFDKLRFAFTRDETLHVEVK